MPAIFETSPTVANMSITSCLSMYTLVNSAIWSLGNIVNVVKNVGMKEFCFTGVPGLYPLIQWIICVVLTFTYSEWAWRNPSLATILLCPSFCLINSKMIVNNVTNMET